MNKNTEEVERVSYEGIWGKDIPGKGTAVAKAARGAVPAVLGESERAGVAGADGVGSGSCRETGKGTLLFGVTREETSGF